MNIAKDRGLIYELEPDRINTSRKLLQGNWMNYPHKKFSDDVEVD